MLQPADFILGAFVTPALATAGVAAVAVPILIHLLARRRFKRIRWAAMDFLIDAERRNRRRIQMEDWILMALRSLAVLLIGLLVARPFFSPTGLVAWAGSQRTERVLVIDDSFSMGLRTGDSTCFDRAKQAVRRIITGIRSESPDDTVTILRTSAPDDPVVAGAFLESSRMDELLARTQGLAVSEMSMDLAAVFDGAVQALRRDPGILSAAVYVVSDFQRIDWSRRDSGSGVTLSSGLLEWAGDDRSLRMYLVNVGEEDAANAAVAGLALPSRQVVAGTEGAIRAQIANYSSSSLEPIEARLTVGNQPVVSANVPAVAERQTVSIDMEASFLRTGDEAVRMDLPRDSLELDDTRYLVVPVVSALRVLIVDGEPSPDDFDDEVALLSTALRPEGEVFSGFELTVVNEAGIDDAGIGQFHVVVLANVFRMSEPAIESLERYVRTGGGLLMFLGDQIDPEVFNSSLYRFGEGCAPAELIEAVRPAAPAHLVITHRLHPALRGLARDEDPLGLGQVPFYTFFAAEPHQGSGTQDGPGHPGAGDLAPSEDAPNEDAAARVLARFDDPQERPAIIERTFGSGRVLLVTSSADKEWNLWADHPTYLPVILELTSYLARSGARAAEQWVGSPIELTVDPSLFTPELTLRPPGYPNEPEVFLTAVAGSAGVGLTARWEQTSSSGIYQFVLRQLDGGEHVRSVAVNTDPRESDLAPADETELRRSMGNVRFDYFRGADELIAGADEKRTELWPICLALAMVLLMTEQSLAWRWGRRR